MSTRIVIADDHQMIREGLRSLIDREADMDVIGEADNGREAVSMARKLSPDVVVMDVGMPDLNGMEAARQICQQCSGVRVLALSMHSDRRYAAGMLEAGAKGYVVKKAAYDELVTAIREVAAGRAYLSSEVASVVIDDYSRRLSDSAASSYSLLTEREREIVQLVAEGRTNKQIADALGVSVKTVDSHRQHVMEKLDLHTVADLTRYAMREGISPQDA
jgi:DNA-binding NarL/FixJ family response regulator